MSMKKMTKFQLWYFKWFLCQHIDLEEEETKVIKVNGENKEFHYKTTCKDCGRVVSTRRVWFS